MSEIKCQDQSLLSSENLNINASVGKSLVRLFDEEKTQLLEQIKERIRVKNSIDAHLQSFTPNISTFLTGTSRTLLFHHKSNMELCVISNDTSDDDMNVEKERNFLEPLVCKLKAEEGDKQTAGNTEIKNLFFEVRLQNKEHFPVRKLHVLSGL